MKPGQGHVGAPGHPGVHRAAVEGRLGVGRAEKDDGDILRRQTRPLKHPQKKIMSDGAAPCSDPLAPELGRRGDGRVGPHQDGGGRPAGGGAGGLDGLDPVSGGIGEDERRIAHGAGIHGAGRQGLQQGLGGGKLAPFDIVGDAVQGMGRDHQGPGPALLAGDLENRAVRRAGRVIGLAGAHDHGQKDSGEREGDAHDGVDPDHPAATFRSLAGSNSRERRMVEAAPAMPRAGKRSSATR